jgi:hypothetical protein
VTTTLPRIDRSLVSTAMFIRPRKPEDHGEFEWLLPQCSPLFVYADENGRDWVRWSLPKQVAEQLGWGEMKCACCGNTEEQTHASEHALAVDTAYDEVDWFLNADAPTP